MKTKAKMILAAAVCSAAFVLPAQQPAVPAVPAVPAKAAIPAATITELLAFLPDVVATADGASVTKKEVIQRITDMGAPADEIAKLPKEQLKMILKRIAENIILEKAMLKKAADAGFKNDEASIRTLILDKFKSLPKEQQDQILAASKKTVEQIADEGAKNETQRNYMALNSYMESIFNKKLADVTDTDAMKFYNDNKETQFKTPATREVSHILVMANGKDAAGKDLSAEDAKKQDADAQAKIKEVQDRLAKGEDFGKLAEEISSCPSGKQNKGRLPAFRKGQMVPEFEQTAFSMTKTDEVSQPVKTAFGYHLIKLHKINDAGYMPYNDALKAQIKNAVAGQYVDQLIKNDMESVKNSNVKFFGLDLAPAAVPAAVK